MTPRTLLLFGYWPLASYKGLEPGYSVQVEEGQPPQLDVVDRVLRTGVENNAAACIWCRWPAEADRHPTWPPLDVPVETVFPSLVFDRGTEIADHLVEWAEGNPRDWFELVIGDATEPEGQLGYGVILLPIVERSIERWRHSYRLTHDAEPPAFERAQIKVVF